MKQKKVILTGLFLSMMVLLGGFAQTKTAAAEQKVTEDGFVYDLNGDKTYQIVGYQGDGGDVTIPGKIDGKKVTVIAMNSFKDNTNITNLTISEGITTIYNEAFTNSSSLETVNLPKSLTQLLNAFTSCPKLTKFTVAKNNKSYYTDNGVLMEKYTGGVILTAYPTGLEGEYTIPKKVTSIGEQSFYGAAKLTKVTIPGTVESISANAFDYCTSLKTVTIQKGKLMSLWFYSFAHCTSLETVSIPTTLVNISEGTFAGCTSLKKLDIAKGNKVLKMIDGSVYQVYNTGFKVLCEMLVDVKLNDGVYTVPKDLGEVNSCAFAEIEGLKTIDFSKSNIKSFKAYQFKGFENGTIIIKKNSELAKSIYNEESYENNTVKYVK